MEPDCSGAEQQIHKAAGWFVYSQSQFWHQTTIVVLSFDTFDTHLLTWHCFLLTLVDYEYKIIKNKKYVLFLRLEIAFTHKTVGLMAKSSKLLQDALSTVLQKHQLEPEDVVVTIVSAFKWGNRDLFCLFINECAVKDAMLASKMQTILEGLTFIVIMLNCSLMSEYLVGLTVWLVTLHVLSPHSHHCLFVKWKATQISQTKQAKCI